MPQRAKVRRVCALQIGQVLGPAEAQRVRAAAEQAGVEQARDIARPHRPVGDAALWRLDLDHRLEPEQAARAGAHDRGRRGPRARGRMVQRRRDAVGAEREGRGVPGR